MKKLIPKNQKFINYFLPGGRFSLSYKDSSGNYKTDYYSTLEKAKEAQRGFASGTAVLRDRAKEGNNSVLKSDRTKEKSTEYSRQLEEAQYNKLSYKDAYNLARKNGKRWFGYKGKVYSSDLKNYKTDNLTQLKAIYGERLGWSNDPKVQSQSSRAARANQNSLILAESARPLKHLVMTNSDANRAADLLVSKTWNEADFVDLMISPWNVPLNLIEKAASTATGEPYSGGHIYNSGFNPMGYALDLSRGDYGAVAGRAFDAFATLGFPGAGKVIDYLGTRFAALPKTLSPKSRYLSKKATVPITDETGTVVDRVLNPWAENAIRKGAGNTTIPGEGVVTYGGRSLLNAANRGMLDLLALNGGTNNAVRYGTAAVLNANTGLTYIYRTPAVHPYDAAIDNAIKYFPWMGVVTNPAVQYTTNLTSDDTAYEGGELPEIIVRNK